MSNSALDDEVRKKNSIVVLTMCSMQRPELGSAGPSYKQLGQVTNSDEGPSNRTTQL